jgi:hypothetical protein
LTFASISWLVSVEPEPGLEVQLVLPLLHEPAGGDDQALLHVVAQDQLLDVQAGHDRLAGAGVVGQQEAQRGPWQQLAVDCADLMGKRLDVAGRHGQHRVEQAGQADPLGLRDQLEVTRGRIERPTTGSGEAQLLLVAPEHHLLSQLTGGRLVRQLEGIAAVPVPVDDRDYLGGNESLHAQAGLELLKQHRRPPTSTTVHPDEGRRVDTELILRTSLVPTPDRLVQGLPSKDAQRSRRRHWSRDCWTASPPPATRIVALACLM